MGTALQMLAFCRLQSGSEVDNSKMLFFREVQNFGRFALPCELLEGTRILGHSVNSH